MLYIIKKKNLMIHFKYANVYPTIIRIVFYCNTLMFVGNVAYIK